MKPFYVDDQTKSDLQIFGSGSDSIVCVFNRTITNGGDLMLKEIIGNPLRDEDNISERINTIRYLMVNVEHLTFDKTSVDFMDHYLSRPDKPRKFTRVNAMKNVVKRYWMPSADYYIKRRGVAETLENLRFIVLFCNEFCKETTLPLFTRLAEGLQEFQQIPLILKGLRARKPFSRYEVERADFLLRNKHYKTLKQLLSDLYLLDAFYSVASSSRARKYVLPVFRKGSTLELTGVFHPLLERPILNDLTLDNQTNMAFITGANMSGKSTFMKSVSIAVYLAHLGFPVPAEKMVLSLLDGIISTINLPDNIRLGESHFYAEANRVKLVAEQINNHMKLLVVFDEFFRGTNIKDAYEASLRISGLFSGIKNCFFLLSTHITEVATVLNTREDILFRCFKTDMSAGTPVFNYELLDGINDDHIGMWILENKGIFGLLETWQKK
ncbi:MutS-related protein [Daejeonella lutea]|uniref:MutS domain III n=1 Tax=Daejeonella lutea TaxID=572036 RepID=A0A1T5AJD1_9SPHI|nr:hypothetical protein [Daejeonella lutea]SKB35000.1 MutS domain III [Daejeonella lutea]